MVKIYIVDASVILTVLLGKGEKVVRRLSTLGGEVKKGKARMIAPMLLAMEVANGLRYNLADEALRDESFERFRDLPINYREISTLEIRQILRQSGSTGTSVYDSCYHFVALSSSGLFLTCDQAYYQKAKGLGSIELIINS